MTWLIRRLLILWLIFCIVCAAAIGLGRLDHTPTTLQTLGFDTCDGDPCFRGLKPGMDWAKVQALISEGTSDGTDLYLSSNLPEIKDVLLSATGDGRLIGEIWI